MAKKNDPLFKMFKQIRFAGQQREIFDFIDGRRDKMPKIEKFDISIFK